MKVYDPYSNTFYDNSEKQQTVASDRTIPISSIQDAIAAIEKPMFVEYSYDMTYEKSIEDAIGKVIKDVKKRCIKIIRKHTGVSE